MVCIAASPHAPQLVRKAYHMAQNTNAEWYVVHISPPVLRPLTEPEKAWLAEAFRLAEEFGARVVTLPEIDVVPALVRFARENNISQIIIGRPRKSLLRGALTGSPVYRLIRSQSQFDLYLVEPTVATPGPLPRRRTPRLALDLRGYLVSLALLAAVTAANYFLQRYVEPVSLYAIYLVAIITIALLFGTGPSVWASILSLLAYDFFFTAPKYTLAVKHPGDAISALVFFLASIAIGQLIKGSRSRLLGLRSRIEQVSLLEEMSRELLALPPLEQLIGGLGGPASDWRDTTAVLRTTILDDIGQTLIRYLGKVVSEPVLVFFRGHGNRLQLWARSDSALTLSPEEQAVAEWVLLHGEPAGAGTDTLANVSLCFVPMRAQEMTMGVIGIKGDYENLLPEQRHLLNAVANLASLSAARWVAV
jgi:two-component system sensor histidine kinase KdpD